MTIEDLIALTKRKQQYDYSQRIKTRYLPYEEKCALAKSVVDNTSYVEIAGKKVYKRNTANMLFVFTMQLIEKYTDIEFDKDDVVKAYNQLEEAGLMEPLLKQIPEKETDMLEKMMYMQRDDLEVNTRSLVSFFETKTEAMQIAMNSFEKVLNKIEHQAEITA